jgi:predicted DNA-binding protein
MDSKNAKQVSITLPRELLKKAQLHCRETGRTFSGLVRVAIEKELKE